MRERESCEKNRADDNLSHSASPLTIVLGTATPAFRQHSKLRDFARFIVFAPQ